MGKFSAHKDELDLRGYTSFFDTDLSCPYEEFENLMRKIGEPMAYSNQPMIIDIKPRFDAPLDQYHASVAAADLHTDKSFNTLPPKYLGIFCISNDETGGEFFLSDGRVIVESLSMETRRILMERELFFPTPGHIEDSGVLAKVIESIDGLRQTVRFRSDLLLKQPDLDPQIVAALTEFRNKAKELQVAHPRKKPGQLDVYDNHRMLHARGEITARPSRRHLLRMYARDI